MQYLPKLEDYMKALELNQVFSCEDEHFIGFKYNAPCVYFKYWNDTTLNARGIVFDKEIGEIVARPFYKFFNYQELINGEGQRTDILDMMEKCGFKFDASQTFRVMDKLDGSLGIVFWDKYQQKWRVKTGGAFFSDQAVWAQKWLDEHVNLSELVIGFTYTFEILYDEDVHPISYDKEEMVLLGIISNSSGEEVTLDVLKHQAELLGVRMADVIEFKNFDEVIPYATNLPNTKEGVVVTFKNGFKVKIKGKEFLELQRKFHNLTREYIWEHFDWHTGEVPRDLLLSIPEEMPDLKAYAEQLPRDFKTKCEYVRGMPGVVMDMHKDRKDQYMHVKQECAFISQPKLVAPIMKLITQREQMNNTWSMTTLTDNVLKMVYMTLQP